MGSVEQFKGNSGVLDQTMEESGGTNPRVQWKQMGYEEKTAAAHEEMKRMNQLPATSTYVTHRLRVLNKILQLLSIQIEAFDAYCLFVYARELLHKNTSWSCYLLDCLCDCELTYLKDDTVLNQEDFSPFVTGIFFFWLDEGSGEGEVPSWQQIKQLELWNSLKCVVGIWFEGAAVGNELLTPFACGEAYNWQLVL
ncbi:hypothetical protein PTKIN_Ptkin14bG0100500 [Pterospermum kingtungense]